MPKVGTAYVSIRARLDQLEKDLAAAKSTTIKRSNETAQAVSNAFKGVVAYFGVSQLKAFGTEIFNTGKYVARLEKSFAEITGSTSAANKEFAFLRDTSDQLGQNFYDLADAYKGIAAASKGTTLEGQATRDIFVAITKASASLGLTADDTRGALTAIQQMMSKGKVSAEELRQQLGERLPGAFNLMAEAVGVSTAELDDMLKAGEVLAEDALPKLAKLLEGRYTGAVDDATRASNELSEAWMDMKKAMADSGFLEEVSGGMKDLADTMQSEGLKNSIRTLGTLITSNIVSPLRDMMAILAVAGKDPGGNGLSSLESQIADITKEIEKQQAKISRDKEDMGGWRAKVIGAEAYQEQLQRHNAELELMEQRLAYLQGLKINADNPVAKMGFPSLQETSAASPILANASKQEAKDREKRLKDEEDFQAEMLALQIEGLNAYDQAIMDGYADTEAAYKEMKQTAQDNAITFELDTYFADLDKLEVASRDTTDTMADNMRDAMSGWASSFSSTLNEMVWNSKASFGDILESFGKMITQMMIQKAIVEPLFGSLFGGSSATASTATTSGYTPGAWGADGLIMDSGKIKWNASGGIVRRPTIFPLSGGSWAGAGEAGPEAIMPLKRINGKLGVAAAGGGTTINIINNVGAEVTAQERETAGGIEIDVLIDQAVASKMSKRGTASNRALRQHGGAAPLTVR